MNAALRSTLPIYPPQPIPSDLANDVRAALQLRKPILCKCWFTSSQDGQAYEAQVTYDGELNISHRETKRFVKTAPLIELDAFLEKFE